MGFIAYCIAKYSAAITTSQNARMPSVPIRIKRRVDWSLLADGTGWGGLPMRRMEAKKWMEGALPRDHRRPAGTPLPAVVFTNPR
ncbi:hypothetical protein D3C71_1891640 [compost metagenome]